MNGALWVLLIIGGGLAYLITVLSDLPPKRRPTPARDRVRVTADELYLHWMSPEAVSLSDDHATKTRVVRLVDGREFETAFADVRAQLARQGDGSW